MLETDLPDRKNYGRPKRRIMDVMKEDMLAMNQYD